MVELGLLTFSSEELEQAISLVARESAKTCDRHVEWIKRRLREAVVWCSKEGPEHAEWEAYYTLARPVFHVTAALGGMTDGGDLTIH